MLTIRSCSNVPVTENPVQNVTFPSNGGTAHGYLAVPESGSGPGLVVIQEWWGLTTHVKDVTDRFAAEGFVALAPDLFGGATTHDSDEAGRLMSELPVDKAAQDLAGAVDFLLGHEAVTSSKVGAVGFCMGGGFVIVLAAQQGDRIGAAVPFYGVLKEDYPDLSGLTAPVLGHFGEEDGFTTPDAARGLADRIQKESGVTPQFFFYPRATRSSTTRTCWAPTTRSRRLWPGAGRWSSCTPTWANARRPERTRLRSAGRAPADRANAALGKYNRPNAAFAHFRRRLPAHAAGVRSGGRAPAPGSPTPPSSG